MKRIYLGIKNIVFLKQINVIILREKYILVDRL